MREESGREDDISLDMRGGRIPLAVWGEAILPHSDHTAGGTDVMYPWHQTIQGPKCTPDVANRTRGAWSVFISGTGWMVRWRH